MLHHASPNTKKNFARFNVNKLADTATSRSRGAHAHPGRVEHKMNDRIFIPKHTIIAHRFNLCIARYETYTRCTLRNSSTYTYEEQ